VPISHSLRRIKKHTYHNRRSETKLRWKIKKTSDNTSADTVRQSQTWNWCVESEVLQTALNKTCFDHAIVLRHGFKHRNCVAKSACLRVLHHSGFSKNNTNKTVFFCARPHKFFLHIGKFEPKPAVLPKRSLLSINCQRYLQTSKPSLSATARCVINGSASQA